MCDRPKTCSTLRLTFLLTQRKLTSDTYLHSLKKTADSVLTLLDLLQTFPKKIIIKVPVAVFFSTVLSMTPLFKHVSVYNKR